MTQRQLLPREDRRASIIRAAATAFARGGFDGTSMNAVATQAGVTRVLLYRHFDSKEALYRAVLDQVLDLLDASWAELQESNMGDAAMRAHLATARQVPDGYRLLWHQADTEPEFAEYAQLVRAALAAIADARMGGTIKPELRAWAVATLIATIIESVLGWLEHGDPLHDEQFLTTSTAGLVRLVEGWSL